MFGYMPDFEIISTNPQVPTLLDDPNWGVPGAYIRLNNQGDEVILRDTLDVIVDAVAYGSWSIPGVVSCGSVPNPGYSLERLPYWKDTDNCQIDFRHWPYPNPGFLP